MKSNAAKLLETVWSRSFYREARLSEVESLGASFRWLVLEGESLRDVNWSPGGKLHFRVATLCSRVYTPVSWDAQRGTASFLIHVHGTAPGADWARGLRPGDRVMWSPPRSSTPLNKVTDGSCFFGDESSIGLALCLARMPGAPGGLRFAFEVADVKEAKAVLKKLGLGDALVLGKREDGQQLDAIANEFSGSRQSAGNERFVLTGRAQSIQVLSRSLKAQGAPASAFLNCAFWAEGKAGLD